jgi:Tfp pilus assembly protein PilP
MTRVAAVWLVGALFAAGCGDATPTATPATSTAPAPPIAALPSRAASMPAADAIRREPGAPPPPLTYQAKGRRDPFAPGSSASSTDDAKGLRPAPLKLTGVIQGRALLALLEAPDGTGYIVQRGDALGGSRVVDLTPTSVTLATAARPGRPAETVTLTLAGD